MACEQKPDRAKRYWVVRRSGRLVVYGRKSLSARDAWALVLTARSNGLSYDVVNDQREPIKDEDLEKAENAQEKLRRVTKNAYKWAKIHADESIMITVWHTPFWAVFLAIAVVLSGYFALRYRNRSLIHSMLVAAAWSALGWVLFDTFFVHGISAFAGIIWADAFLGYLPLAYVCGLVTRIIFRRKLHLRFRSVGFD